jgi:hypothetical protein
MQKSFAALFSGLALVCIGGLCVNEELASPAGPRAFGPELVYEGSATCRAFNYRARLVC